MGSALLSQRGAARSSSKKGDERLSAGQASPAPCWKQLGTWQVRAGVSIQAGTWPGHSESNPSLKLPNAL